MSLLAQWLAGRLCPCWPGCQAAGPVHVACPGLKALVGKRQAAGPQLLISSGLLCHQGKGRHCSVLLQWSCSALLSGASCHAKPLSSWHADLQQQNGLQDLCCECHPPAGHHQQQAAPSEGQLTDALPWPVGMPLLNIGGASTLR